MGFLRFKFLELHKNFTSLPHPVTYCNMCSALGFWPPLREHEPFPGQISVVSCWGRRSALYGGLTFPVRGFGFGCTSGGPTLAKNPETITLGLKLITNCDKLIRKEICDRRCSDKRGLTATIQDRSISWKVAREMREERSCS